jgi:serine/threonine protein kinase
MEEKTSAVLLRDHDSNQAQGSIAPERSLSIPMDANEQGDKANSGSNIPCSRWDPTCFETLTTLGKGNYATVYLAESSQTKQLFAMKVRSKVILQANSEMNSMSNEKEILLLAKRENHPFVVEVFGGFQTQSHILLYLEFCQGGDLLHHLNSGTRFGIERVR